MRPSCHKEARHFTSVQELLSDLLGALNGIRIWQRPFDPALHSQPDTTLAVCWLPVSEDCHQRETCPGQVRKSPSLMEVKSA